MDKSLKAVTRGQCDARPTVTFPAAGHHRRLTGTKLYWLLTEARVCVNNLPKVLIRKRNGREWNPQLFGLQVQSRHHHIIMPRDKRLRANSAVDVIGCRRGVVVSGVRRMNEVNPRRAQLVPGWVTVFGRVYHLGM